MPSIFVLGASGYIGGAVLATLLKEIPDLKATALVRNETYIAPLSNIGVTCIKGTHQDSSLITELSSKADIVLNTADADDGGLLNAILDGCKKRFTETSVKTLYIHTSGTAIFLDGSAGVFNPSSTVYDDRNKDLIKGIAPTAPHRVVEQSVVDADEAGYVSAYIISPSGVYGESPAPSPRGVLLTHALIKIGTELKALPYIGDGSNISALVHIDDLTTAYTILLKWALSGKDTESGYGRYYIATGGEETWIKIVTAHRPGLKARGIIETADPLLVTTEKVPMMFYLGANVRAVSGKLRDLGWNPSGPSLFECIERDIEVALKSELPAFLR